MVINVKTIKDNIFEFIQKETLSTSEYKEGITTKVIAASMKLQRSNVSAILNELVKEKKLEKSSGRPVLYSLPVEVSTNDLHKEKPMIGSTGSLAKAIQIAKAAILYPNNRLNVLISSKPGCGTSRFVYSMFLYAVEAKVIDPETPFIRVNCRHYLKNIEELNDVLFGRGGHSNLEKSSFAMARKGMLFIENVELLNAYQLSLIVDFLDSGLIYSEDKDKYIDCNDTFIVLSCDSAYINQFNQRIPMVIEIPELKERPLSEKLNLINNFFSIEANNAKRNIEFAKEVMQALMLSDFSRNIRELEMEIKKACATAYVRTIDNSESNIEVGLYDFNSSIMKSLVKMHSQQQEIVNLLGNQNRFIFDCNEEYEPLQNDKSNILYGEIHSQYDELSKRGINAYTIQDVINNHVNNLFKQYNYYHSFDNAHDDERLSKIVHPEIIKMVRNLLNHCQEELQKRFQSNVFYGLCLHMNSLLTLRLECSRVDNDQVISVVQEYPKEFAISTQFAQKFQKAFDISLPTEEIVIITMFLVNDEKNSDKGHPVLLYILHGVGTADSLKEVTNRLTQCNNAYGYDLPLEKDISIAMEEIKVLIKRIDNGGGSL